MVKSIEELKIVVNETNWFSAVGLVEHVDGGIILKNIHGPWHEGDAEMEIADNVIWLPQYPHDDDPFHKVSLMNLCKEQGKEKKVKELRLELNKMVLESLRVANLSPLQTEWSDSSIAAKRCAAHAFRSALTELVIGVDKRWCKVVNYYKMGLWPWGYLPEDDLIVLY